MAAEMLCVILSEVVQAWLQVTSKFVTISRNRDKITAVTTAHHSETLVECCRIVRYSVCCRLCRWVLPTKASRSMHACNAICHKPLSPYIRHLGTGKATKPDLEWNEFSPRTVDALKHGTSPLLHMTTGITFHMGIAQHISAINSTEHMQRLLLPESQLLFMSFSLWHE